MSAEASEMSSALQQPEGSLLDRHHPNASFAALSEQVTVLCDASWRIVQSDRNIQFFIVDGTSQPVITCSVTVETDLSWNVFINGKQLVVDGTPVLSDLPRQVPLMDVLSVLLERVLSSNICLGNPDHDFVEVIVKEGGQFLGTCGEIVQLLMSV